MSCGHCGANLSQEDMHQPKCRFCGTVLAHYARAAEKVAVVNAMMRDANGNGIPDALEGMAGLPTGGPVPPMGGAPMTPGARPMISQGGMAMLGGGPAPPMGGGPVGSFGPMGGAPDVYGHARRGMRTFMIVAVVGAVVLMMVIGGAVFAVLFATR